VPPASRPEPDGADPESASACRRRAMDLLARREHSRYELERKLGARGFEPTIVAGVLDALAAEHLLEEQRFVESFIRSRIRKGQGPARIRAELVQRGIDDAEVAAGLAEADCDWVAIAAEARRKRFGAAPPASFAARAKQANFLQYRGFEGQQIRAALELSGDSD
jgi:regulatory protein